MTMFLRLVAMVTMNATLYRYVVSFIHWNIASAEKEAYFIDNLGPKPELG